MRLVVINKNACFIISKKRNSINPSHKRFADSMELVVDQIASSSMKKELCSRTKETHQSQINLLNQDLIEVFVDSEPNVCDRIALLNIQNDKQGWGKSQWWTINQCLKLKSREMSNLKGLYLMAKVTFSLNRKDLRICSV